MDTLRRTWNQFREIYDAMSSSQRMSLIVVTAAVVGGFAFLMFRDPSGSYRAASLGSTFSYEELVHAENTLIEKGLTDYRREGNRILVPAGEEDVYTAALLEAGTLPSDWGSELAKQVEESSIFSSPQEARTRRDAALASHLRRVLRQIPSVQDAQISWAADGARRFSRRKSDVTATVFVWPRGRQELSRSLVHSIRLGVAGAVSDLQPENVVIIDQVNERAHTAETDDALDNRLLTRISEFEKNYYEKISAALSYIDEVLVTVNVDLEKVKSSIRSKQTVSNKTVETEASDNRLTESFSQQPERAEPGNLPNQPRNLQSASGSVQQRSTEKRETDTSAVPQDITVTREQLLGAMPEAVQVSISIPDNYYRAVALQRGLTEGTNQQEKDAFQAEIDAIEQEVNANVQTAVRKTIPAASPADAVSVVSYTSVETPVPEPSTPVTETLGNAVGRWGGAVALGLFALWTLWMLNRSLGSVPQSTEPEMPDLGLHAPPEDETRPEPVHHEDHSLRDDLQSVVRDSPELTASVLAKWIQQSNR